MTEKTKKLIESPNRDDVLLGFELLYREKVDSYFRSKLTEGDTLTGFNSDYIYDFNINFNTNSLLVKLPKGIIIHCLGSKLLYHEYVREYNKIKAPKYESFDVHEIQEI